VTRKTPILRSAALLAAAIIWAYPCAGPTARAGNPPVKPKLTIPRVTRPPRLEDFLNMEPPDALGMVGLREFTQRRPDDGKPATERMVVYLGFDEKFLYAVGICYDTHPERIRARMARREDIFDDDMFALSLDTFHDGRRGYLLLVNPLGIQADGIVAAGQDDDYSFDTLWYSRGQRTPQGYVVWMAIPFKSLRFPSEPKQVWGVAVGRFCPFRNEQDWWPYLTDRIENILSQFATADGLENISPGRNLQFIPYAFSRSRKELNTINTPPAFETDTAKLDVGLDAKAVLKDALVMDVTLNPDFSQVESDEPQVTVNQRFEVFFPERRPFFLENATFFKTPINLLFTRRIVDPQYGVRMTGKLGHYALGAFFADDRGPGLAVANTDALFGTRAYNGILRVSRDFFRESTVGLFFADREYEGSFNRILGPDLRWKFKPNWILSGQAIASGTHTLDGKKFNGPAYFANLSRSGRSFNYSVEYDDISPNFQTADGFIPRVDLRQAQQYVEYDHWPKSKVILKYIPQLSVSGLWNHAGQRQDWVVNPGFDLELRRQTGFFIGETAKHERFQGIDFQKHNLTAEVAVFAFEKVGLRLHYERGTDINFNPAAGLAPFLGQITTIRFTNTLRPNRSFRIDNTYIFDRLIARGSGAGIFNNHIARTKLNYQFTPRLSVRTILQYQSTLTNPSLTSLQTTRRFTGDLLFTYLVHPGTVLYVGYNDILDNPDPRLLLPNRPPPPPGTRFLETRHELFVKFSYLFRF
jgi:Domain of unknown function (DUF5916)